MSARALGLVGLAARAGSVTIGTGATRAALQRGDVRLVVLAGNRSPRTVEKVERLARGSGIPILVGPDADMLGSRVGRGTVQAIGIADPRFAEGILAADPGRVQEA